MAYLPLLAALQSLALSALWHDRGALVFIYGLTVSLRHAASPRIRPCGECRGI